MNKINKQISAKTVLVVDEHGQKLGTYLTEDAIIKAQSEAKDLIEIVGNVSPPVCKIIELGKFQYEQRKQQKHQKRAPELKEFQFGINIDPHDLRIKADQMSKLLSKHHPIRVVVKFRGREIEKKNLGYELIENLKLILPKAIFDTVRAEEKTLVTNVRYK